MHDDAAIRVLVVGGMANLVLSFVLGFVLSHYRLKGPMAPHHWLLTAHVVALQEGAVLLGIGFAMTYARLPHVWSIAAAWLLVVASALQDASGIVNWLRRTDDQFKERSAGWVLATINAFMNMAGLLIAAYGVVRGVVA